MTLSVTILAHAMIIIYAAIADRMRGGYPDDSHWINAEMTPPRWKHWLRKYVWYTSGMMISIGILQPNTLKEYGVCLLASVLFAQGDRQDMDVMGQLIVPDGSKTKGYLGQLRIGAVFAVAVAPAVYLDARLWPMLVGCALGPIVGTLIVKPIWFKSACLDLHGKWAWMELFRGAFMAFITLLVASLSKYY